MEVVGAPEGVAGAQALTVEAVVAGNQGAALLDTTSDRLPSTNPGPVTYPTSDAFPLHRQAECTTMTPVSRGTASARHAEDRSAPLCASANHELPEAPRAPTESATTSEAAESASGVG